MKGRGKFLAAFVMTAVLAVSCTMVSFAETGWVAKDTSWYYYFENGTMATDQWVKSNGNMYWLGEDGVMATNQWVKTDERYYYVDGTGVAETGWNEIEGKWYYFYSDTHVMAVNAQIDSRKVGRDGAWIP